VAIDRAGWGEMEVGVVDPYWTGPGAGPGVDFPGEVSPAE
jgi:hypothetical protein